MERRTVAWWRDLALSKPSEWRVALQELCDRLRNEYRNDCIAVVPPELLASIADEVLEADSDTNRPLLGVPVAIKDNIDAVPFATTAGCREFAYQPRASAFVVDLLRSAGAVIVAKTNLDQFATGLVGVRTPFGTPVNARDRAFVPGGSSAGSATLVGHAAVPISLGTDTAGSGRVPAFFNGIVGLKPSRGRLSTRGVVPACASLDCVSVFANSVADARLALEVLDRYDADDRFARRHASTVDPRPIESVVVPPDEQWFFDGDEESCALWLDLLATLRRRSVRIVTRDFTPLFAAAKLLYEDAWVAERFAALGEFVEQHRDAVHPTTGKVLQSGSSYSAADLFRVMWQVHAAQQAAQSILAAGEAILLPTVPRPIRLHEIEAQPIALNSMLGHYTNFMNLLDMCGIAVPWGQYRSNDLRWGFTLIGASGSDYQIAHWAADLLQEPAVTAPVGYLDLVVCGAHLSGLALHYQLADRNARLVQQTQTAPRYRMLLIDDREPHKPGLVLDRAGRSFPVEVWRLPTERLADFAQLIPEPLALGSIELQDGTTSIGFVCQGGDYRDISGYGGWRAYVARAGVA